MANQWVNASLKSAFLQIKQIEEKQYPEARDLGLLSGNLQAGSLY